ncbi:hypothetical protein SDC9_148675 [bioreactor metagenome]|uniref:Uncharacterized protein n=1 Tax=bioreactor metagenome TaxID=1076179 RepID=A0A645EJ41_9ZZZZ
MRLLSVDALAGVLFGHATVQHQPRKLDLFRGIYHPHGIAEIGHGGTHQPCRFKYDHLLVGAADDEVNSLGYQRMYDGFQVLHGL